MVLRYRTDALVAGEQVANRYGVCVRRHTGAVDNLRSYGVYLPWTSREGPAARNHVGNTRASTPPMVHARLLQRWHSRSVQ